MDMGMNGARQNLAFHVPPEAHIIHAALGMGDADRVLFDDRAFIEISGDVVGRRADQSHAALIGLLVRFAPLKEGRKEWWMLMMRPDISWHSRSDRTCM